MRKLSRRGFVAGAASSTGLVGKTLRLGADAARRHPYIDIHVHVGRYYWGRELTLPGVLKLMDKHGVERACVLPLVSPGI